MIFDIKEIFEAIVGEREKRNGSARPTSISSC